MCDARLPSGKTPRLCWGYVMKDRGWSTEGPPLSDTEIVLIAVGCEPRTPKPCTRGREGQRGREGGRGREREEGRERERGSERAKPGLETGNRTPEPEAWNRTPNPERLSVAAFDSRTCAHRYLSLTRRVRNLLTVENVLIGVGYAPPFSTFVPCVIYSGSVGSTEGYHES